MKKLYIWPQNWRNSLRDIGENVNISEWYLCARPKPILNQLSQNYIHRFSGGEGVQVIGGRSPCDGIATNHSY